MELQLANRTIYVQDMATFQPMGFGIHTGNNWIKPITARIRRSVVYRISFKKKYCYLWN
jgi:hypothetical protein